MLVFDGLFYQITMTNDSITVKLKTGLIKPVHEPEVLEAKKKNTTDGHRG